MSSPPCSPSPPSWPLSPASKTTRKSTSSRRSSSRANEKSALRWSLSGNVPHRCRPERRGRVQEQSQSHPPTPQNHRRINNLTTPCPKQNEAVPGFLDGTNGQSGQIKYQNQIFDLGTEFAWSLVPEPNVVFYTFWQPERINAGGGPSAPKSGTTPILMKRGCSGRARRGRSRGGWESVLGVEG